LAILFRAPLPSDLSSREADAADILRTAADADDGDASAQTALGQILLRRSI
jgi:hypothetical protein